jgi:hypothetical protein
MAFNLKPPKYVPDLFAMWDVQVDQHLCSLICVGAWQSFYLFGYLEMIGFFIKN